jgi:phosphohistidine phosphatase
MAKRLILMRHAKSSWATPGQLDHHRPLNTRGQLSAEALGRWLEAQGYEADLALVSTAQRTQETYAGLDSGSELRLLDSLYNAGPAAIMAALRQAEGDCVLLIAHNPGIGDFAQRILAIPPDHPRFDDYPTGATLVADLEIADWTELTFGAAITTDFITARDLTD